MVNKEENYRHYVPAIGLSIERNTNRVPQNGRFYVIYKGTIIESFQSRKRAEQKFYQLLSDSGYKPGRTETQAPNPSQESLERYFQSRSVFWAEGPIRRGKGGRGGRGGV